MRIGIAAINMIPFLDLVDNKEECCCIRISAQRQILLKYGIRLYSRCCRQNIAKNIVRSFGDCERLRVHVNVSYLFQKEFVENCLFVSNTGPTVLRCCQ